MASEDSSFNASGPTVVAFETISGPEDRAFGVSVVGNVCGVFGQGGADPQDDRTSPKFTGVLGKGDWHGVYGVGGNPDIGTVAPDFSEFSPLGIGVVGVTQSADLEQPDPLGSPAILGLNDVQKTDFIGGSFIANFQHALTDVTKKPIAVAGLSRAGHGVCGLSLNMLDRTVDLPAQPNVDATLRGDVGPDLDVLNSGVTEKTEAAGVIGIAMTGPGLRGVSLTDRGAIFQSATYAAEKEVDPNLGVAPAPVAQIRLVPHWSFLSEVANEQPLPAEGKMGDLLALATLDPNHQTRADLWFCVGRDNDTGRAVWGKLAFSDTVIGTRS